MQVHLNPLGAMDLLSQLEVERLQQNTQQETFQLFRNCALAVLNVGSETDSSAEIYDQYRDFTINLLSRERGIKIELNNPPARAFVDGQIIKGIHEHLFAVLPLLMARLSKVFMSICSQFCVIFCSTIPATLQIPTHLI